MLSVSLSEEALSRLRGLVEENGQGSVVRFREYRTGTPCCRKAAPGLTIDDAPGEDDVTLDAHGLTFVAEPDFVDVYGEDLTVAVEESRLIVVRPD
ncbi:MAG: ErpA-related iron-sulfur cluster insertion protein [Deltaproteobacteria bacterium]|jgi:Fe-S cluster assembly iron-binding protein IscA|nr:ErpA-related iron-sulfur cluster insertion protein [Deltaproteobacteria bacterium]